MRGASGQVVNPLTRWHVMYRLMLSIAFVALDLISVCPRVPPFLGSWMLPVDTCFSCLGAYHAGAYHARSYYANPYYVSPDNARCSVVWLHSRLSSAYFLPTRHMWLTRCHIVRKLLWLRKPSSLFSSLLSFSGASG